MSMPSNPKAEIRLQTSSIDNELNWTVEVESRIFQGVSTDAATADPLAGRREKLGTAAAATAEPVSAMNVRRFTATTRMDCLSLYS